MRPLISISGSRALWSHRSSWAVAVGYILLVIALETLLRTPWAKGWVEQQNRGLFQPFFNEHPMYQFGYNVTDEVIEDLAGSLFYTMLVIGLIASLIAWPISRPVALGVF